jgi:hypothetical protein
LEGWVQEKIIKANDYLNTIREYLEHKVMTKEGMAGRLAGGAAGALITRTPMGAVTGAGIGSDLEDMFREATMGAGVIAGGPQYEGVAEAAVTDWHGSNTDMKWYDAYKNQPVRVKIKNHSGIGSNPAGTYTVRSFKKIDATKAELTINTRMMGEMTGTVDLDNPQTVVTKKYDRVPAMDFYLGSMPVTPRQAFNMFQYKNKQQGVAEDQVNEAPARDVLLGLLDKFYADMKLPPRQNSHTGLLNIKSPGTKVWTRGDGTRYRDPGSIEVNYFTDDKKTSEKALVKFWPWLLKQPGVKSIGQVSGEYGSSPMTDAVGYGGLYFSGGPYGVEFGSLGRIKNPKSVWRHKPFEPEPKDGQGVAEGSEPAPSQMYKMGWNDGVEDEINDQLRQDPEYIRGFRDGLNHAMGPRGRGRSNPRRYGSESGVAEGSKLDRLMRKYVPGSAKRQIDDKIKDQQFTQLIAKDGDPNDPQNQKEIHQTQRNIRRLNRVGQQGVAEGKITEKAVSKAQQKFMGMVHATQKGEKPASSEVAKVAKSMPKKAAKDFAQTKHKGLPQHVGKKDKE